MKKIKNENVAESNSKATEHRRKSKQTENTYVERTHETDKKNHSELPFKKVLYGYDTDEVSAYIKEVDESNKSALSIQQSKLASMQEELVLSNRERDSFREKYISCKEKLDKISVESTAPVTVERIIDNSAEYNAELSALRNELELLKAENSKLKQSASKSNDDASKEYISKIASLEAEKNELRNQIDLLNKKNNALALISQKYDKLCEEHRSATAELEILKADMISKKDEIMRLNESIAEKTCEINIVNDENEQIKTKLSDFEIKIAILSKQISEREEEISSLKETNKAQAYDYAQKLNTLEHESSESKLALQKNLQLHNYHISQAELILTEMNKQMEQIRQSFSDIQSV